MHKLRRVLMIGDSIAATLVVHSPSEDPSPFMKFFLEVITPVTIATLT